MKNPKIILAIVLLTVIAVLLLTDITNLLHLSSVQENFNLISHWVNDNTFTATTIYLLIYIAVTTLSIPGAVPLSLLGGALFGTIFGSILVSFASTIGATLAFLFARYLLRSTIEQRFSKLFSTINRGLKTQGIHYLLTLRLIPLFPFAAINLAMGLTQIRTTTYFWVSQLGMLPATVIFVNAGTQLATIQSSADIVSPSLIISLSLLGTLPLIGKTIQNLITKRKIYKKFDKPATFDRNLIVIGGGAAGLVSSYIAAATQAKVTLIEKHKMGGDCLNTGCVPSKALLRSAKFIHENNQHKKYGIDSSEISFSLTNIMQRVQSKISAIEPHDSIERYESLGVECLQGNATLISPWVVEVDGKQLSARNIILATGARPSIPRLPGIDKITPLTSDSIWQLQNLPKRLVIIGGGAIGCELGQCFARFGSQVTLIHRHEHVMNSEDSDISKVLEQQLAADGINLITQGQPIAIDTSNGKRLTYQHNSTEHSLEFDEILIATGRTPNVEGLGLENIGLIPENGQLNVNENLQTDIPNIYAAGDLIGPFRFTHAASHQAWYASVNALFGFIKKFKINYDLIPITAYCAPEISRIGLNEQQAVARKINYEITRYSLADLDRAITDDATAGFIKVLTKPGSDKILGVTIVGDHASDMISQFALAMKNNLGLNKILSTTLPYPSYAEANKFVAGNWRKKQTSARTLNYLNRLHNWLRH